MDLVAQRHACAAVLDDDAVVVRMLLAARLLARLHVEIAHVVVGHLVAGPDQVVALDALQRRIVIGRRRDVVPRARRLAMADEAHRGKYDWSSRAPTSCARCATARVSV